MPQITIRTAHSDTTVSAKLGQTLAEVLKEQGAPFSLPCGGNHTCGACRLTLRGKAVPPLPSERAFLTDKDLERGIRLACFCRVAGDLRIDLTTVQSTPSILSWAPLPDFTPTETGLGIAVDIGTTTVAARLYDLRTKQVLSEAKEENAQRVHGADVISRITACGQMGTARLSQLIRGQITRMTEVCLRSSGRPDPVLSQAVITGNTIMLHIYEGIDPSPLAVSPFKVPDHFGRRSEHLLLGTPVYLPRCVGAFVGADAICAALSSGLLTEKGPALLADIGTNGEILLRNKEGALLCCSTAAGPAFEGVGISSGVPAAEGAVSAVFLEDGQIRHEVIGEGPARGLCGSGVLDLLAVMKRSSALEPSGYLSEPYVLPGTSIAVTQQDVRQIQLAKSAIYAGIKTLLHEAALTEWQVDRLYIAGGFGNRLNTASAGEIRLLPYELLSRAVFAGNAALAGAAMLLMAPAFRKKAEKLAEDAFELSLAASPYFRDSYLDSLSF